MVQQAAAGVTELDVGFGDRFGFSTGMAGGRVRSDILTIPHSKEESSDDKVSSMGMHRSRKKGSWSRVTERELYGVLEYFAVHHSAWTALELDGSTLKT